jgi:transcription-repair coupling factor (superfamily II helicase)
VRGGLLDIWPISEEEPVRVDFFGETIETLRTFSPETGKSQQRLKNLVVTPAEELGTGAQSLLDYLEDDTLLIINEPSGIEETYRRQAKRYQ